MRSTSQQRSVGSSRSFRRKSHRRRGHARRRQQFTHLTCESLEARRLLAVDFQGIAAWTEQGPGPITLSSGFIQAGAIEAVAVDPTNADNIFVGTVNGGVWRTTTGTYSPSDGVDNDNDTVVDNPEEFPSWEPLTDQFASLSISDLAISPQDTATIYAATGRTSAGFGDGGSSVGLLRTTDGGNTWMQVGPELIGLRVRSVVPTGLNDVGTGQEIVLAASDSGAGGVFRSIDGGTSFTLISGSDGSTDGLDNNGNGVVDEAGELNLPNAGASHLVADPANANRYYVGIPQVGVFRSDNAGVSWQQVNGSPGNMLTGLGPGNFRTELAVHNTGGNNVVYAAIIRNDVALPSPPFNSRTNRVFAMFRSTDMGANWRQLQNMPVINPGAQAGAHFAMIAHPTNPNVLFVGGDANDPTLVPPQMTRYRMVANDGNPGLDAWQLVTDTGTVDNTRPHADSRDLAFGNDGNGNLSLIETDDGGIYRLFDPDLTAANRRWESINGDIRVTESYSIAYDALNGTLVTGTQDNGTSRQRDTGDPLFPFDWNLIQGCDGGVVWADNDQVAHPNETLIYTTAQNFSACGGTQLRTIDNVNNQSSSSALGLVVNGAGGRTLTGPGTLTQGMNLVFDNTLQFVQPYAINDVDPTRMIIGTNFLYESTDQGATLTSLGGLIDLTNNGLDDDGDAIPDPDPDEWAPANAVGPVWQTPYPQSTPIAYGGMADGMPNPDVLWIGAGGNLLLRTTPGGLPNVVASYSGGSVTDIVMDPEDWRIAYLIDQNGSVFRAETDNAGSSVTFTNLTGNLPAFATDLRTIEFIRTNSANVLLVGGQNGVYRAINPGDDPEWSEFGSNLPNAPVNDLQYYGLSEGDVLTVGTFGRGVWKIDNASQIVDDQAALTVCGDENQVNQDDEFLIVRNQGNPLLVDVFLNNVLRFQGPLAAVHQINIFGQGGNDTLTVDTSFGLIDIPGGIRYDGDGICYDLEGDPLIGVDRGFDTLIITQTDGDVLATESLHPGNLPGSGRHILTDAAGGSQIIDFEELEPVLTNVPAAAFDLSATPGLASLLNEANTVEVSDARLLVDGSRVTIDSFEPVEFSQKQAVIIDTAAGDDSITVYNVIDDGVLVSLEINAGSGQDRIYAERVYDDAAVTTTLRGGSDNDVLDASPLFAVGVTLEGNGGQDLLIGGGGNDNLAGGSDDDTLEPGGGDNFVDGGGDYDTIVIHGTDGADVMSISQDSLISLVSVVNGDTRNDSIAFLEAIHVDARLGTDIIRVNQGDNMVPNPDQSLPMLVEGGPGNATDRLILNDDALGDLVVVREGFDAHSGSATVGPLAQIDYLGIEDVTVTPLNTATGATGSDQLGRLFVFHPDRFELNDSRLVSTHLGVEPLFLSQMSITPGAVSLAPPLGDVPGDEDWFEFMPNKIGTYRIDVLFEQISVLANGRPGLPNDGDLDLEVYDSSGTLIVSSTSVTDNESVEVSMLAGESYFVRVYGFEEAVNVYDLYIVEVDLLGPVVDSLDITGEVYDLFDPKPSVDGPTPPITTLTVSITDPPPRAPGDLYPALDAAIASNPGHYLLVGDHNGPIGITNVIVINDPPVVGLPATATIELQFAEPLPDDRYTLTVFDGIVDPPGNQLDGETNAIQPLDTPLFPSGDGVSGGDFVARFTVDSRPEIGVTAATRVYVDINGNFIYDPEGNGDITNKDLVFRYGSELDAYFAGNFADAAAVTASGFDKLGAFGFDQFGGVYRFLLDFDHNGVPDLYSPVTGLTTSALPVAGDFAPGHPGDEIGLFAGDRWFLDTTGDNIINLNVDTTIVTGMRGIPVVGDVNGDGSDDLIVFDPGQDIYVFDLNRDGVADDSLQFGISDYLERPVIGDLNLDGVDDIGFWVAGSSDKIGEGKAEWHFLVSDEAPQPNPNQLASPLFDSYSPQPLGNDLFAHFGDRHSLPVFGNFDPPVVGDDGSDSGQLLSYHNDSFDVDVSDDGYASPFDALLVIRQLNASGSLVVPEIMVEYDVPAPYWDVNNDRMLSPLDVLLVIRHLNNLNGQSEGEGESEVVNNGLAAAGIFDLADQNATVSAPLVISQSRETEEAAIESNIDGLHQPELSSNGYELDAWLVAAATRRDAIWDALAEEDDSEELLELLSNDVLDQWYKT